MNPSAPFIARPVATTLLTLGVALAGIVAFFQLPVAPLPQTDYPYISVSASLPGASPETMAATVATPLERALGRIAGVTEITSSSSLGSARVTLEFELSRDINGAARDVQAAINAARSQLPTALPSNPTYRKMNPADAPIMSVGLTSETLGQGDLYDIASTILAQKISQVSGVGQVDVGGSSLPAVRVELNPHAMARAGISPEDARTAIVAANANRPKGFIEEGERRWQIGANDQAKTAAEYLPLIIRQQNGATLRLQDVAEVRDSVQDVRNAGFSDGKPAVLLIIYRQPAANIIETVDRVKALLPQLKASIPANVDLAVGMDRTPTIRASLREVERTLVISIALVVMVVFVFLRNARATLIPSVAVPVSLIGTFSVMYLAGFSLNNLSLMALTVATGFVVDDAVVVLENISRHIEAGMKPVQAALVGAKEIGFTVVSMSLSLIAVFIPLLFMGDLAGRLFREFAVTLSVAVLILLLISLTTTPMMCARLLRAHHLAEKEGGGQENFLQRLSARVFDGMLSGYRASLDWALEHGRTMMMILLAVIGLNVYLYIAIPKGLFPQQDTGRMMGNIQADQSISFQAMRQKLVDFMTVVQADPAVDSVIAFTGGSRVNSGRMFIALKPLAKRDPIEKVMGRLRSKLSHEPGANLFLVPVQDIRAGGRQSNAQYQYTLQADTLDELRQWEPRVRRVLAQLPELVDVNTDQEDKGAQTKIAVDRDAAARLGIDQRLISATLNDFFGQRQVSTIYNPLNQYRVIMEAAPRYLQGPETLEHTWLVTADGTSVPLSAFASYAPANTPLSVNHQGQFAASTVSFNLPENVSLSQASEAINVAMAKLGVPTSIHGSMQGTARLFQQNAQNQIWLILAALATIYIVLGMLYESTVHPLTILSTLPSAGVGALIALLLFGMQFTMIAFIGVILLIGIVKKNAIMMIDFAIDAERKHGMSPREAIREACLLRFRPIMMTTVAAIFGALPLMLGRGDGAEMRQPLGIAIVGGLILSQLLTLYTTPVVHLYLDRFRLWCLGLRRGNAPQAGIPEAA
ncbi:MAG: multidrug efflux RND transporter permease subunit [Betaproteobacteria bacterium]|nr:multidrug efflux RND transporter permease subunit [Betaproteobacteria bacterium]